MNTLFILIGIAIVGTVYCIIQNIVISKKQKKIRKDLDYILNQLP